MRAKLLSMLIAILTVISLTLAGCGGGGGGAATTAAGGDATEAAASVETFDVGNFTIDLPSGWKAFPQSDIFADADENGNKPIDPAVIYVSKDAADDLALLTSPYVMINHYNKTTTLLSSKDMYENVEDLDVTIQSVKADEAYEGDGIIEGWRYQIIQFSTDDAQYMITIPTKIENKDTGYSYDDPEIKTILDSIKGK